MVTNSQDQVLIAQRALSKSSNPGKWSLAVAGTLEDNETYEENIYKEAETVVVDWDIAQFKIQEEEVKDIQWISPDDLIKDLKDNPSKYTSNFPRIVKSLLK